MFRRGLSIILYTWDDPVKAILLASAERHAQATLPHITSGHYEGEHWLASFAVYLLTVE